MVQERYPELLLEDGNSYLLQGSLQARLLKSLVPLFLSSTSRDAMAFLDEVSPRGWSMKFGHRRRLVAAAHGTADKKWGRSTVKRSVNRGRRLDDAWEDKNKSHRWRSSKVVFITVLVGNLAKARSFLA